MNEYIYLKYMIGSEVIAIKCVAWRWGGFCKGEKLSQKDLLLMGDPV